MYIHNMCKCVLSCLHVYTGLCHVLLEGTPINDIISLLSHHHLFTDHELTALSVAPSDHLKKVILLRKLQHLDLTEWSTICTILQDGQLQHISDHLTAGMYVCMYVCMYVRTYVRTYVCMYVVMCFTTSLWNFHKSCKPYRYL